jgi:DNA primase
MTNTEISTYILQRLDIEITKLRGDSATVRCFSGLHEDRHPSMNVSLEKAVYHCWSCATGGSLFKLYYETFGNSVYQDLNIKRESIQLIPRIDYSKINFDETPDVAFSLDARLAPLHNSPLGKAWLKKRGFLDSQSDKYKMKYCQYGIAKNVNDPADKSDWVHLYDRAIIPIYEKSKLISFEARDLKGEQEYKRGLIKRGLDIEDYPYKKVLFPKNSSVNTLYNIDLLDTTKRLYVTEGIMDVASLQTNNEFNNTTCIFHAIPTERQLYLLKRFKDIVYIPNNDLASFLGLRKLKESLGENLRYLTPPKEINDVNDILQGKHPNIKSLQDLVNKGWLKRIMSDMDGVTARIKSFQ